VLLLGTSPAQTRDDKQVSNIERGACILWDCVSTAQMILKATGSEASRAQSPADRLKARGMAVRVLSWVCVDHFGFTAERIETEALLVLARVDDRSWVCI